MFDLGDTLEHTVQGKDILMSGAKELLQKYKICRILSQDRVSNKIVSPVPNYRSFLVRGMQGAQITTISIEDSVISEHLTMVE